MHFNKTISINGADITVGAGDGWDSVLAQQVLTELAVALDFERVSDLPGRTQAKLRAFVDLVVYTEKVEGDLGIPWPAVGDGPDAMRRAFEALSAFEPAQILRWRNAIMDVSAGPGEDEFKPGIDEKN